VKRSSARLFSPTALTPLPDPNTLKAPPTLTATVASEKLARFFQPRSTTPERSLSDSKPDAR